MTSWEISKAARLDACEWKSYEIWQAGQQQLC